jgi:hypothetical protein
LVTVAVGVFVFVCVGTLVDVWVGSILCSRVGVGSKRKENRENGVVVAWAVVIARRVTAMVGSGVADSSLPVTGMTMGLGASPPNIFAARAIAVLFMFEKDRSCVARAWISRAVGGLGLNPATTNTIHIMVIQRPMSTIAWRGVDKSFSFDFNVTGLASGA